MTIYRSDLRPSVQHARLMAGTLAWNECHPSVHSWAQLEIFERARRIAKIRKREDRIAALEREPETIRDQVRLETIRIYKEKK